MQVPYYTADDVRGTVSPADAVGAVRDAYAELAADGVAEPRTKLVADDGIVTGYLAHLPRTGYSGAYTYTGGFSSRDAWFVLTLYDAATGEPAAVIDGASLNPLKTGAVGAVGTDALAHTDASRLAVFGGGLQARWAVRALTTVRDIERLAVYTPSDTARGFAEWARDELGVEARAADTPAEAVSDTDIVHTATTSAHPVFDGDDLPDGAHVTAAGQYDASRRELDSETVARSKYVLDLRQRADYDAGALILAADEGAIQDAAAHVHAELAEALIDENCGRTSSDDVTVFDSGGTAVETVAVGALVHRHAEPSASVTVSPLSDERRRL